MLYVQVIGAVPMTTRRNPDMSLASSKLALLNNYRAEEGLSAYKDWRPARHQSQLDAYNEKVEQAQADAEYAARKQAADEEKARREAEEAALIEAASKPARKAKVAVQTELQTAAEEKAKGTSYKQMPRHDKSLIEKPVGFVHQFLSDNPGLTRKAAILALVDGYGVNYSTARTQYQRWFQARNKA